MHAYFLLGIPGAGKSTLARKINLRSGAVICNPDNCENYVEGAIRKFIRNILFQRNVILDFINTDYETTSILKEFCSSKGYKTKLIYFQTSPIIAASRVFSREHCDKSLQGDKGRHVSYYDIEKVQKEIDKIIPIMEIIFGKENIIYIR